MGNISNCIVTKFGPEALQTVQILSGAVVLYLLVLIYCKKEVNTVVKVAAAAVGVFLVVDGLSNAVATVVGGNFLSKFSQGLQAVQQGATVANSVAQMGIQTSQQFQNMQ